MSLPGKWIGTTGGPSGTLGGARSYQAMSAEYESRGYDITHRAKLMGFIRPPPPEQGVGKRMARNEEIYKEWHVANDRRSLGPKLDSRGRDPKAFERGSPSWGSGGEEGTRREQRLVMGSGGGGVWGAGRSREREVRSVVPESGQLCDPP